MYHLLPCQLNWQRPLENSKGGLASTPLPAWIARGEASHKICWHFPLFSDLGAEFLEFSQRRCVNSCPCQTVKIISHWPRLLGPGPALLCSPSRSRAPATGKDEPCVCQEGQVPWNLHLRPKLRISHIWVLLAGHL